MDTKIIVEKALKGEDYSTELNTLPEDQRDSVLLEVRKGLKDAADAEQTRLVGLRQASKATEDKGAEKKQDFDKFKEDQLTIAKNKFFSDASFPIDEAKKTILLAEYAKNNSGSVDASLIFNDLKKTYASIFADDLLSAKVKLSDMEKNAALYNAGSVNANGGINTPENDKYSKETKDLYKKWVDAGIKGKTLDDAQKITDQGQNWRGRSLA